MTENQVTYSGIVAYELQSVYIYSMYVCNMYASMVEL